MSDAFGDYLHSIGRIPLLTAAEEVHLGTLVQQWMKDPQPAAALERRGRRAMARMVKANLRLVVAVVLRHQRRITHLNQDPMDLVQAGNLGLMRAVEKFDPSRGYKFSTYGYWWIRQSINRYLQEQTGTIRLPVNLVDLAHRAESIRASSEQPVSRGDLASRLGESEQRLQFALTVARRSHTVSLDQQLSHGEGDMTLLDMVSDGVAPQPHDDYQWMHQQVSQLERRERTVLELRYRDQQTMSFAKIAEMTGLSKDQVQRLERNALQKLRRRLTPILNPECASRPLR